jgi:enediyne biosynthesis protein E3
LFTARAGSNRRVGRSPRTLPGQLRLLALGISPREVSFARRGFHAADPNARRRLERLGVYFLEGYHASVSADDLESLTSKLDAIDREYLGFAYEGAAMGLTLLDLLLPWSRRRLPAFLAGPGADHAYLVHVGVGWAIARVPLAIDRALDTLDPILRWLAIDGYGFHEGFFHPQRSVPAVKVPSRLVTYARQVFDQGVGRSLWFAEGADATRLPATVGRFDPSRHENLWSGVGVAATYAGGAEAEALNGLRSAAGPFAAALAQGASFAAKARQRAGNTTAYTELACRALCGLSAEGAAAVTDVALMDLPLSDSIPAYETWQRRIRSRFE